MHLIKYPLMLLVCAGISACGSLNQLAQNEKSPTAETAEIRPEAWHPLPACVRLSADVHDDSTKAIHSDYRESIGAHLLAKGYTLTQDQNCSFVFSSRITQNSRGFFGFFSRAVLAAQASLKDSRQGKLLWSSTAAIDFSDGALPFSLVGISTGIYKASESMSRDKELMAIDALSRKLLSTLPYMPTDKKLPLAEQKEPVDIDKWLSDIPEMDRPQSLQKITQGAYSNELKEKAYARLCLQQNTAINRRQWAQFKASTGDHENAINVLLDGKLVVERDPESQFLLGRLYSALSRYSEADQAYVRASGLNSSNPLYLEGLAYVNTKTHNYPRALAAYEKMLQISPSQSYAYMNMAEIQLGSGHVSEAIANYVRAAEVSFSGKDLASLKKIKLKQQELAKFSASAQESERAQLLEKVNGFMKQLEEVK